MIKARHLCVRVSVCIFFQASLTALALELKERREKREERIILCSLEEWKILKIITNRIYRIHLKEVIFKQTDNGTKCLYIPRSVVQAGCHSSVEHFCVDSPQKALTPAVANGLET